MLPLAGLVAAAVGVIIAVAYWSLRSGGSHEDEEAFEPGAAAQRAAQHPLRAREADEPRTIPPPGRRVATGPSPAAKSAARLAAAAAARGGAAGTVRQPAAEGVSPTPPDGLRTERQGDDVAKSRPRTGLADRVGWRRRSDVDEEMWPEEGFGGVSDEQFWDDLASDKPLATTARTAQPEGAPLPSPAAGPRHGDRRPAGRAEAQPVNATTQAFPVFPSQVAQGQTTGPQPVRQATGPQPIVSSAPSQPSPVRIHPPAPPSHSLPPGQLNRPATGPQPLPAAQHARPAHGLGRHSADEDPLTSSAYSLRSNAGVDGRSYHGSRRSRELTRDQYEAAISQETQTFSIVEGNSGPAGGYQTTTPPYGYELPPAPARQGAPGNGTGRAPDPYRQNRDGYAGPGGYSHPYTQPAPGQAGAHTPPYGDSYGYDRSGTAWQAGRGQDRDYATPAVKGGRPADPARGDRLGYGTDRPGYGTTERPAYQAPADRPAYQTGYSGPPAQPAPLAPYDSRGTHRRG